MTVIGSISADFSDIACSGGSNFPDVIRYGMVREVKEEGGLLTHTDANRIKALALEKTSILGFFRWVRRTGKPEFIGITKLGVNFTKIKPDIKEVAGWHKFAKISITEFSDFVCLQEILSAESL